MSSQTSSQSSAQAANSNEEERKFLHDIANPLAVAAGMLEAYREDLSRSQVQTTDSQIRKLQKVELALGRIAELLVERRSLISVAEPKTGKG